MQARLKELLLQNVRRRHWIAAAGAAVLGVAVWLAWDREPKHGPQIVSVQAESPAPPKREEHPKPAPLRIRFDGSAAPLDRFKREIKDAPKLTPAIAGKWRWADDRTLEFQPEAPWPVGREYRVELGPSLFPDHIRPKNDRLRFKTPPFKVGIKDARFYLDPFDPKLKRVVATFEFSHRVEPAAFERLVSLRLEGQRKGFLGIGKETFPHTVTYGPFKREAYIHSAPIEIGKRDSSIKVLLPGGTRAEAGGAPHHEPLEREVKIPGIYNVFRVQSARLTIVRNERYDPEQVLVMDFSNGALSEEVSSRLKAWVLPLDLPAMQGRSAVKDYYWGDVRRIGPEVLEAAEPLPLEPLPTEREYAKVHSFRFKAVPGRAVYFRLERRTPSYGGFLLAGTFDCINRVPKYPQELQMMHDGSVLSLTGRKTVTFIARGIPAVRFEIGRVLPGQINHLVSQSGGDFRNPKFKNWQFSPDHITERFIQLRRLAGGYETAAGYLSLDLSKYLADGKRGLFFVHARAWDPSTDQPLGVDTRRMILVTDLGLIVKESRDGGRDVFVQSIATGRPAMGVRVSVLGRNGLPVLTRTTGASGRVEFPPLGEFRHEKAPTAFIAKRGRDPSGFEPSR